MSEFIIIQVGQCGNQIGNALWPFILDEYGISNVPDGVVRDYQNRSMPSLLNDGFHSFFYVPETCSRPENFVTYHDLKQAKVKARAVLIDMENGVIGKLKRSPLHHMFGSKYIITDYPGSGNNWAEGYYEHGNKYGETILQTINNVVEKCDTLHGFILLFSLGGGTGSGLGTCVLKLLDDFYPAIDRFVCPVYPLGTEDVITAPYNVLLATKKLVDHASCVFPVENRSLMNIITSLQQVRSKETMRYISQCKPFQDMNSIIVNMLLHLTSGSRFPGVLNIDVSDIITNMIPYPRMHFLTTSLYPFTLSTLKSTAISNRQILENLYSGVTHYNNQLVKLHPLGPNSILLGATLQGRGALTVSDMRYFVKRLQTKGVFTKWSETAVKLGLCSIPPAGHDHSLFAMFNTTAVKDLYTNILNQYSKLYKRKVCICVVFDGVGIKEGEKAHTHHYIKVNGFDPDEFCMSSETIRSCIDDYNNISMNIPSIRPRYEVL